MLSQGTFNIVCFTCTAVEFMNPKLKARKSAPIPIGWNLRDDELAYQHAVENPDHVMFHMLRYPYPDNPNSPISPALRPPKKVINDFRGKIKENIEDDDDSDDEEECRQQRPNPQKRKRVKKRDG